MRSLITGGAGFIGSHIARLCLDLGHEVVVLDDLSGGFVENVPPGALFVRGSVEDQELLSDLFARWRFNYIYHLAAYAAEGLSHFIRAFNYRNNLVGSINLINQAVNHEIDCFVFTSSIAVYGRNQLPMTEDLVPRPEDPYGISKYAVELDLRAAREMFGLNYVIFRPHNVYGENQNIGDPYRNVIGIFMNQIMQGKPLTIFGDGSQTRAFSYIGDVAQQIARSVQTQGAFNEVINIGADQAIAVLDLARMVMRAFGREVKIEFLPERNEVQHAFASHEKARRLLGTAAPTSIEHGLGRMADWARQAGARTGRPFNHIEIEKALPPSWAKLTFAAAR